MEVLPKLEEEARKRQGARNDIGQKFAQSDAGRSREQAGKLLNVNHQYVSDAKRIKEQAPEIFEEARKRQATSTGGRKPQLTEKIPEAEKAESRQQAGHLLNVNERYVSDAKRIKEQAPDADAEK
ncbi:MAG TPA: hypothetical protein PL088_11820 [Spirochaetota bacterium]|nr:hypothetical protein [Spirochaetota bacterium]